MSEGHLLPAFDLHLQLSFEFGYFSLNSFSFKFISSKQALTMLARVVSMARARPRLAASALVLAGTAVAISAPTTARSRSTRALRAASTAAWNVADYTVAVKVLGHPAGAVHERGAGRLRKLMERQGGVYIKLGQHVATLDYLVPPEYCKALGTLMSSAPTASAASVRRVVAEELGVIEEVFAAFDEEPVASGSLAQVHRAETHDGRVVAVKVQHEGLRRNCDHDLASIAAVSRGIAAVLPEFTLQWLVDEVTKALPRELDFTLEGHNAELCGKHLEEDGETSVAVPRIDVRNHALPSVCRG